MRKVFFLLFFYLGSIIIIEAQISTSSPYSRFGLGDLYHSTLPEFNALGGASVAYSSPFSINPTNPATYASYGVNSFLLSTGGWHQTTKIQSASANQIANNNGFSHLILGFPLFQNFGASIGMLPFSSTGYEISTEVFDVNAPTHSAIANYYGDGGISKIYFGGAYKSSEGISVGVNASFLFGGLNRRKQLIYDEEGFLNSRSNSKINLKGYYYEFGLLYDTELLDNDLSIAFTLHNNSAIRAKRTELIESFEFSGVLEIPKDTFVNSVEWGDLILPQHITAGFAYNKNDRWLFLADYSVQNWQDYTMLNESDDLVDSRSVSAGVRYIPDHNSITHYYKRLDYNIGLAYSSIPLQFDETQLEEISVSFGVGIPVKRSRTKYYFSCTLGQRGVVENNLLKEQFVRLGLSVSYDGIWFVKSKYD